VLQARHVRLRDVGQAIQYIEPACLELAALRPDRHTAFLPELRALQRASQEAVDDATRYRSISQRIHAQFVQASGCETLILIAGSLEALWIAHARRWAICGRWPKPVTRAVRESHAQVHGEIIDAVASGDAKRAAAFSRLHLAEATQHTLTDQDDAGIDATTLAPVH
jgi:DNA-binding GntR family transcriptional regulator